MPVVLRLRTKLFILFLALLLIPVIGTGLYGQYFFSSTYNRNVLDTEQRNVNSVATHVRTAFIESENNLVFPAGVSSLNILTSSEPESALYRASQQVLRSDVLNFARTHPMYEQVGIYNDQGEALLVVENANGNTFVNEDLIQRGIAGFVEQVLREPVGSTHFGVEERADGASFRIIFAFRHADGLILTRLRTMWLFQPETFDDDGGTWSLQLPNRYVLHFAPEGAERLSPEIETHDDWLRNSRGYYITGDRHVFYQNITIPTMRDRYNLTLFHTVPSRQTQADLSLYYQTFATLAFGGVLCVIALAMLAIDRFVAPIRFLKLSMDSIRETQKAPALPRRLPPDEIGELTLAFYAMAGELETKRKAERALVDKLITAQEEERKRIAYDLHDGLLQLLVGARFYLNQCKNNLQDQFSDSAETSFAEGYESLSTAIVEGRRIMNGLHPSTLDDLGLVEALEELAHNAARLGGWDLHLELDFPEDVEREDKTMRVTLYRIAQEALNNVCKHANAHNVQIKLWTDQGIHLVIADDGEGFVLRKLPHSDGGWGLRTMRERINLLHGTIQIQSQVGVGTTITMWIPKMG